VIFPGEFRDSKIVEWDQRLTSHAGPLLARQLDRGPLLASLRFRILNSSREIFDRQFEGEKIAGKKMNRISVP
jgi:hypothetical protein